MVAGGTAAVVSPGILETWLWMQRDWDEDPRMRDAGRVVVRGWLGRSFEW
jgi:hypothetical protein